MNFRFLLLAVSLLAFAACDRTEPVVTGEVPVSIATVIDGNAFEVGQEYDNLQGRKFRFDGLKLYVSDIVLVKDDGTEVALTYEPQDEPIWLYDFTNSIVYGAESSVGSNGELIAGGMKAPVGDYQGAKILIGVRDDLNGDRDPVDYPVDHPLSEQHSAFWTWNSGYIFLKIDGRFDDSSDASGQSLEGSLTYHTGLDTLIRNVEFLEGTHGFSVSESSNPPLQFELDVQKLFYFGTDTLDMVTDHLTHTTNNYELAETITNNLANHAISLE